MYFLGAFIHSFRNWKQEKENLTGIILLTSLVLNNGNKDVLV